jgi:hypothetical protein
MTTGWRTPTLGRMMMGLLLGAAFLMLLLSVGCGSSSSAQTDGQDEVTETTGAATEVADKQERAIARAWAMAQVAMDWNAIDPAGAQQAIADSVRAAEEAASGGDEQRRIAADLREKATDWAPVDWRSAIALAERIERNASRAWMLRAIAGELADTQPAEATSLLTSALEITADNPLPQYRAEDESTVAVQLAGLDADRALVVAAAIADPAARARALREISAQFADTDPELAATTLADAVTAAKEISDPNDRAWALRESALAPAADVAQARQLLDDAAEAADQIEDVVPQAFAQSDIAVAWAALDLDEAMTIAEGITPDYPEARVAALVGIAERIAASNPAGASSTLEQALEENERALDKYESGQAVNAIVADMALLDKDRAVEIARGIEDPYLQADALRSVALAAADASVDNALALAAEIKPTFIRVQVLTAIGEKAAATDPEKAKSIFEKALSEAGDLDDTYPLRLLASAWAPLDPAKALEIADRVQDSADKAAALTDVAMAMLATDPEEADVTLKTAQETATGIKSDTDPFAAATALRDMATTWSTVDEAEAGRLYADAFQTAKAVSLEPTG